LKNREEKKKKGSWGGDNPAHKVYNVYVLLCFVIITGEMVSNHYLARKAISIYAIFMPNLYSRLNDYWIMTK